MIRVHQQLEAGRKVTQLRGRKNGHFRNRTISARDSKTSMVRSSKKNDRNADIGNCVDFLIPDLDGTTHRRVFEPLKLS
jgi:hypothetical protein